MPPKRRTQKVRTVFGAGGRRREAPVAVMPLNEELVGPANHARVSGGEALAPWPDAADAGGISDAAIFAALGDGVSGRPVEDALADLDAWPKPLTPTVRANNGMSESAKN